MYGGGPLPPGLTRLARGEGGSLALGNDAN